MPTERLSMRRIRQVLQLHFGAQASARVIAREVGVGRSTVQDYLARAARGGAWLATGARSDGCGDRAAVVSRAELQVRCPTLSRAGLGGAGA